MNVNLPLLAADLGASALFVFWDARRRRVAEAQASDDWELKSPHPWLWAGLTALFAPLVLPVYLLLDHKPRGAALAALLATAGCVAAWRLSPTDRVDNPFAGQKAAPWSAFPPGLPPAARKAAEQLPQQLAVSVQKLLPGLIDFARGYEQGAEITIQPGLDEARVILELKAEGFLVLTAVRVFSDIAAATRVLADETRGKDTHQLPRRGGRPLVLDGPRPAAESDATASGRRVKLDSYEQHANVLIHLLVIAPGASPETDAAIEAFTSIVSEKLTQKIEASETASPLAH